MRHTLSAGSSTGTTAAKVALLATVLWVVGWRVEYVIRCLTTPRSFPEAILQLAVVILVVLLLGSWLGHEVTRARRFETRTATHATRTLRATLATAEVPLTDDECDAVLMRFQEMGLLTLGVTEGELTVQETPIGSLYRDIFS
jgi:uncharacterized membrane protein